ncbi:MAG: aminoacyl-tRNA hydrolase [Candidatus Gracilibacteria bacterium]
MKLIVGLGNPGNEYALTRHNAGWIALDHVIKHLHGSEFRDSHHKGMVAIGEYQGEKILFLKPLTYMNLSGESVVSILNFYKIDPRTDMLVLSDDIDMEFGKIRLRQTGSSGGQNGLKSIEKCLGTQNFARLKIGIGRHEKYSVSDWVLSRFTQAELDELEGNIGDQIMSEVEKWLANTK